MRQQQTGRSGAHDTNLRSHPSPPSACSVAGGRGACIIAVRTSLRGPDMAETPTPDALAAEFDCLMARAGITVPQQRRDAVLASYADLRGQIALLHGRFGPEAEPSNV